MFLFVHKAPGARKDKGLNRSILFWHVRIQARVLTTQDRCFMNNCYYFENSSITSVISSLTGQTLMQRPQPTHPFDENFSG